MVVFVVVAVVIIDNDVVVVVVVVVFEIDYRSGAKIGGEFIENVAVK